MVTVDHLSVLVHGKATVSITVKGKAHVKSCAPHVVGESLNVRGAAALIDVCAIGICPDHADFGSQRLKYGGRDHPGSTRSAVQAYLEGFEGVGGK